MPELPEVETTRRGLAPHLVGRHLRECVIRQPALRWPVPADLRTCLTGQSLTAISRRGKYLLFHFERNTLIAHLGMSGSLRIVSTTTPLRPHDHVDLVFEDDLCLRYHDPRRFGCLLPTVGDPFEHPLLQTLGVEPLEPDFTGATLHMAAQGKTVVVKNLIMDSHIVVGVGNIYANEALFAAGIRPTRPAQRISAARYQRLVESIKTVLSASITAGGSTLRDYVNGNGQPGYFQLTLQVYDRTGLPCLQCGTRIRNQRVGQRGTFYCPHCQH